MSKFIRMPYPMNISAPQAVRIDFMHGHVFLTPQQARELVANLSAGPDNVEAFCFILNQGADAVDACEEQRRATHEAWLLTQPERP